jgi:uncharacterized membrane protein
MSPGTAAVITIGVIALAAMVIVVVGFALRRKQRRSTNGSNLNPLLSSSTNYQAMGNSDHE